MKQREQNENFQNEVDPAFVSKADLSGISSMTNNVQAFRMQVPKTPDRGSATPGGDGRKLSNPSGFSSSKELSDNEPLGLSQLIDPASQKQSDSDELHDLPKDGFRGNLDMSAMSTSQYGMLDKSALNNVSSNSGIFTKRSNPYMMKFKNEESAIME
jgi:hypothetical protein